MKYDSDLHDRQDAFLERWKSEHPSWDEEELDAVIGGWEYVMDNQDRFSEVGEDEACDMGRCIADGDPYWRRHGGWEPAAECCMMGIRLAQRCCREVGAQR